jgi:hypothetical protein
MLQTVLGSLLEIVGIFATPFVAWAVERGIAAYELHAKIKLTDQQRAVVLGAADTVSGVILARIGAGSMSRADLVPGNPAVHAIATASVQAIPDAATALQITGPDLARIAVGKVGHALAEDPTVPTIPAQPGKPQLVSETTQ